MNMAEFSGFGIEPRLEEPHKEHEDQRREVYIHDTNNARWKLGRIAEDLSTAYEGAYRTASTYKNEERMRYWRYKAAEHFYESEGHIKHRAYEARKKEYIHPIRRHGRFGGLTEGEKDTLTTVPIALAPLSILSTLAFAAWLS